MTSNTKGCPKRKAIANTRVVSRSEEHTSELQSQSNLVCRLLLEKKKTISEYYTVWSCANYLNSNMTLCVTVVCWLHTCLLPYLVLSGSSCCDRICTIRVSEHTFI